MYIVALYSAKTLFGTDSLSEVDNLCVAYAIIYPTSSPVSAAMKDRSHKIPYDLPRSASSSVSISLP